MRARLSGEKRLPGDRQTQVGVPVVVPVVVDVEAIGIEIADVHAVAVRVEILSAPIRGTEARGLLVR